MFLILGGLLTKYNSWVCKLSLKYAWRLEGRSGYKMILIRGRDAAGRFFSTGLLGVLPTFPSGREDSVNCPVRKKVTDIHLDGVALWRTQPGSTKNT